MHHSFEAGRLVRDGLLWHAPVSIGRVGAYTIVVLVASFAVGRHALVVDGRVLKDQHAVFSLEQAIVRAYCKVPWSYSHAARVADHLKADMSLRHMPLRDLVVADAGSIEKFCEEATFRVVNNENSLMLIETAILRVRPNLSLSELGESLHLLRVAILAVFVGVLITVGSSLWFALGATLVGLVVLNSMPDHVYSVYPFLFTMVLALASVYGLAIRMAPRLAWWLLFGVGAGLLSALIVNMRTSYLPVVAVSVGGALAARWRTRLPGATRSGEAARALACLGCFLAGYAAFQVGVISNDIPPGDQLPTTHSVAHPLVLALSVPETPFSRAQGLRWDDEVGPEKARSIDPGTDYLGPRYNRALIQYYWKLWAQHPAEMLAVYRLKFATSGTQMLEVLRGSPGPTGMVLAVLLAPLDWIARVLWLVAVYALIAMACLVWFATRRSPAAFVLGILSAAACLIQIESGVIYSMFAQQYHNYSSFYAMLISMVGLQILAHVVARTA